MILLILVAAFYVTFLDVVQDTANLKNKLIPANNVLSTATNISHKCIVSSGSTYINDPSSNGLYFITCNKCKLQYEEKTSQNLNKRFN